MAEEYEWEFHADEAIRHLKEDIDIKDHFIKNEHDVMSKLSSWVYVVDHIYERVPEEIYQAMITGDIRDGEIKGKNLELSRIEEIEQIANRHGFRLGRHRTFNQPLTDEQIESVRRRAGQAFRVA